MFICESSSGITVGGLDAGVVEHAAGVDGVAGDLAGAPRVRHAAVLAVAHQRRCASYPCQKHTTYSQLHWFPCARNLMTHA